MRERGYLGLFNGDGATPQLDGDILRVDQIKLESVLSNNKNKTPRKFKSMFQCFAKVPPRFRHLR